MIDQAILAEKLGFVSKKTIIPITLKNPIKFNYEGINAIRNAVLKIINYKVSLIPILSTHYQRDYYLSDNKKIRSTLDYDIKSHQIIYKQNLNFQKNFNDYIFELKYEKKYDNFVRKNLSNMSSRYSKSSKYINCAISVPQFFS